MTAFPEIVGDGAAIISYAGTFECTGYSSSLRMSLERSLIARGSQVQTGSSRGCSGFVTADPLLEGYRYMSPDLDRQDNGCRQQEGSDRNVSDRRNHHG